MLDLEERTDSKDIMFAYLFPVLSGFLVSVSDGLQVNSFRQ